jgi:hypothetical protein
MIQAAPLSIWRRPIRLPRWKPRRIKLKLRASRVEYTLLSTVAYAQVLILWAWGLCCWRLGTLIISTIFLMIVLHNWREE